MTFTLVARSTLGAGSTPGSGRVGPAVGRCPAQRGFALAEVLVAAALVLVVAGAALALMDRIRAAFDGQAGRLDVRQRARVATAVLEGDLVVAGAGVSVGADTGPLVWAVPPIAPYRRGQLRDDGAASVFYRPDTISLLSVPPTRAQARVRSATALGSTLVVEAAPNCGPGSQDRLCGFAVDMRVMILDPSGAYDLATVAAVDGTRLDLLLGGVPAARYDSGRAVLAEISAQTYYVESNGASETPQLMQYDGYRTARPAVDHVVGLDVEYFGDPEPPRLLEPDSLDGGLAPRTTYGPRPPAAGLDDPLDTWAAGENCVFARVDGTWTPRLGRLADHGSPVPLVPAQLQDGPWCLDATRRRYDADLLRVRRVRVHLRVQAADAALRGPAGRLFARGGRSTSMERFVPDQRIQFDVTPRNLNFGR
jgi:prepilin-type N-terminal cleavage/methylation domain-containing protein